MSEQSDDKITVSKEALRQVLAALVGPSHYIRELQLTREPAALFKDNPINILLAEFNEAASRPKETSMSTSKSCTNCPGATDHDTAHCPLRVIHLGSLDPEQRLARGQYTEQAEGAQGELLPCPFCGETPELTEVNHVWMRITHSHVSECILDGIQFDYPRTEDGKADAISDWNRRAALAQPSPAPEVERPEVVAWQYRVTAGPQTGWSLWTPGKGEEFERSYTVERRPLMTVAQHDRIAAAHAAAFNEAPAEALKPDLELPEVQPIETAEVLSRYLIELIDAVEETDSRPSWPDWTKPRADAIQNLIGQHDRIVGALRAENARLREERDSQQRVAIRAMEERDAAQARVAELVAFAQHVKDSIFKNGEYVPISTQYVDEVIADAVSAPQAGQVPEGFALVPIQLTDEMRDAGNVLVKNRGLLFQAWRAMLAAAPAQGG